jgi:hypothetical protein
MVEADKGIGDAMGMDEVADVSCEGIDSEAEEGTGIVRCFEEGVAAS